MRILAIDDDESIRELLTQILTFSGYHDVTTAASAKEALEKIGDAEQKFDCFLADIQMPEIDGIFLTKLIRQTPGYEHTPIIMLTAMHAKRYLDDAFEAGATDYVTKPFDFMELRSRIQEAQKVSYEKERLKNRPFMAGELKGMGGELKDIRFDQPIALPGVDAAIDYHEFENYVKQLSRRQLSRMAAVAVEIEAAEALYAKISSEEFLSLVRDVAMAAQETLLADGGMLSYRGNGMFLCINERRLKASQKDLARAINKRISELHPESGDAMVRLLVGDQVSLDTVSEANALESLSRAVDDVKTKKNTLRTLCEAPRRLLQRNRLSEEQKRLEKRAYESLLREALSEVENDSWHRRLSQREKLASRP